MRLTLQPRGSREQQQVTLSRRQVKFNPVSSQLCSGGDGPRTGYIRVGTFSRQTVENLQSALRSLQVQPPLCCKTLCFDPAGSPTTFGLCYKVAA